MSDNINNKSTSVTKNKKKSLQSENESDNDKFESEVITDSDKNPFESETEIEKIINNFEDNDNMNSDLTDLNNIDEIDDDENRKITEKGKRGRKKIDKVFTVLPDCAVQDLNAEDAETLQKAFEVFQVILDIKKLEPFAEKPNAKFYGMSNYYKIISTPMWLNEIDRKFISGEYKKFVEFVRDIRTMIRNCYKFWGKTHKFSKKAFHIEQKFEDAINDMVSQDIIREIIEDLQIEENLNSEDIAETIEDVDKENDNDDEKMDNSEEEAPKAKLVFISNVIGTMTDSSLNRHEKERAEYLQKQEQIMLKWEKTLVTEKESSEIRSMWQLAAIGYFLRLTGEVLNIEEITQYEIERMLLMPRESVTLAIIMTSFFTHVRSNLECSEVLTYDRWNNKLQNRVESWFSIYLKESDEIKAMVNCGIDPAFWPSMGLTNPLENKNFHDLTFFQRCWILKSLCDDLYFRNKSIQEIFEQYPPQRLRVNKLGVLDEYQYFYLPFLPEVRIYKQRGINKNQMQNIKNYYFDYFYKTFDQSFNVGDVSDGTIPEISNNEQDFYLIAADEPEVEALCVELSDHKGIVNSVKRILKKVNNHSIHLNGLEALYSQYHNHISKTTTEVDNEDLNRLKSSKDETLATIKKEVDEELPAKRRKTTTYRSDGFYRYENSSDEFSSDDPDWETRKRKKSNKKRDKKKKSSSDDISNQTTPSTTPPPKAPQSVTVSPVTPTISSAPSSPVVEDPPLNEEVNPKLPKESVEIKIESIEISSDEEDIKPDIVKLNSTLSSAEINISPARQQETPQRSQPMNVFRPKTPQLNTALRSPMRGPSPQLNTILQNRLASPRPRGIVLSPERANFSSTRGAKSPVVRTAVQNGNQLRMQASPIRGRSPINRGAINVGNIGSPRNANPGMGLMRGPNPLAGGSPVSGSSPVRNLTPTRGIRSPMQRGPSPRALTKILPKANNSPRGNSPFMNPRMPQQQVFNQRGPQSQVRRTLFSPNSSQQSNKVAPLIGKIMLDRISNGDFVYIVKLPDGGVINLTNQQLERIQSQNGGIMPDSVQLPLK